ncbi:MAG: hypothetical protein FIB01_07600, partial [Gemmatimonadetes bacterium]|nr:hypothetical protein [Gemmatimonadota bacterium]
MRFFERWSGKRAADSSKGQFGAFAAKAAKDHASSEIALLDVMQVVDALAEALAKRFPELDQAAANDFAAAGLRLRCHRCGPLGGQAVHTLYLAGSGVLGESLATGPGAARLAQGRCPGCGSTTAVAEFFAGAARGRAEQLRKVKRASRSWARGKRQLLPACPDIPYLGLSPYNHDFEVSPGGNLVCCLTTGGSLGAYEAGTDRLVWTAPVPATDECLFRFVGLDRLLVLSGPRNERGRILLINTSDGSVIDATNPIKLEYDVGDSDYRKGLFVGRETHRSLLFVDAAGDRIVVSPLRVDDQIDIGPRIGPDGHT